MNRKTEQADTPTVAPLEGGGRARKCAGPRASKAALLHDLQAAIRNRETPFSPIWVVTSSSAHRRELLEAIPRALGRATLGIVVHTLHSAAHGILKLEGKRLQDESMMFPWWLRRAAGTSPTLTRSLGHLKDGFGPAANAMLDLRSAGFHAGMFDAAKEALGPLANSPMGQRALALMNTLRAVGPSPEGVLRGEPELLLAATEAIGTGRVQSPQTLITGIMDATNAGTEFLSVLLSRQGSRIYLDYPQDPAVPGSHDVGVRFADSFISRLGLSPSVPSLDFKTPSVQLFDASGRHGEANEIARRVRKLLDTDVNPEDIGVVSRTLDSMRQPLEQAFSAWGIPWSIPSPSSPNREQYRPFRGLIRLLREGNITPMSPWLESLSAQPFAESADLSLGARTLGLAYVGQYQRDLFPSRGVSLPIRENWTFGENGWSKAPRRHLSPSASSWLNERLSHTVMALKDWPDFVDFDIHMEHIITLAEVGLGWESDHPAHTLLSIIATNAARQGSPPMTRGEAAAILETAIHGELQGPRTEERSGVKILDGTRARGLTFEHLFLCQVNRGSFPRVVSDDPLLPDQIRISLQSLMPELAPKSRGHDEERFLFSQLFGAANHITLSWLRADDDGKELGRSVFVDRLLLSRPELVVESMPRDLCASIKAPSQWATALYPPQETALAHVLDSRDADLSSWLAIALEESADIAPDDALELAEFRSRVLHEIAPNKATPEGRQKSHEMGPMLGLVGPATEAWDPRHRPLSVTALEDMASCPWNFWLRRMLQLEPAPMPTMAPPDIPSNLVGTIVHDALEDLLTEHHPELRGRSWDATTTPVPIHRPTDEQIVRVTQSSVERSAASNGILSRGTWRLLTLRALPFVHRSVNTDWPSPESVIHVVATESRGTFGIPAGEDGRYLPVSFKADRIDRVEDGWRLVDYKTGMPAIKQKREKDRRNNLVKKLSSGELLQGMGYSVSVKGAVGTYRYLSEKAVEATRELTLSSEDAELHEIFLETTGTLHAGMAQGVFFPRLESPEKKANRECEYCDFVEACTKNDSSRRERIRNAGHRWRPKGPLSSDSQTEDVFGQLFHLGFPVEEGGES